MGPFVMELSSDKQNIFLSLNDIAIITQPQSMMIASRDHHDGFCIPSSAHLINFPGDYKFQSKNWEDLA